MSFVGYFPLEIVHEIFLLSIDLSKFQEWNPVLTNRRTSDYPTFLISICHTWSSAALSCPRLWSTLPIVIQRNPRTFNYDIEQQPASDNEYLPPLHEIVRWIDLSGSAPLAVSLRPVINGCYDLDGLFSERYGFLVQTLLNSVLLPRHFRWASISLQFSIPFPTTHDIMTTLAQSPSYANLTEISFYGLRVKSSEGAARGLVHVLSRSPKLSSVALHGVDDPRHYAAIHAAIPWKGLSRIFLDKGLGKSYSAQAVLHLLRDDGIPGLNCLGISMHQAGEHLGSLHIRHEKLRELDLHGSCPTQFIIFITHLTLPNLRSLTMPPDCMEEEEIDGHGPQCGAHAMPQFETAVPAFIKRSGCRLEKLNYHEDFIPISPERSVLPILHAVCGSVEHLEFVVGPHEVGEVLRLLRSGRGPEASDTEDSFPRLKHLTVKAWVSPDALPGEFSQLVIAMIESRWNASKSSPLRTQTQYIDVGMRVHSPSGGTGTRSPKLKAKAWGLMGAAKDAQDRLRALVDGPESGVVLGQVNYVKRIRVTVGALQELESGIFKPFFDTGLDHGVWAPK